MFPQHNMVSGKQVLVSNSDLAEMQSTYALLKHYPNIIYTNIQPFCHLQPTSPHLAEALNNPGS